MTQPMQNKTAVVTGATSGIGRASVVDFATHGVNVVASGRREDRGAELVEETQGLPGDVIFVRADVTVAEDVENLMSSAVSQFGRIDYAFNNAGAEDQAADPCVSTSIPTNIGTTSLTRFSKVFGDA